MILSDEEKQIASMNVENRALQSLGGSSDPVYQMVAKTVKQLHPDGGVLVDVGCGSGRLWSFVSDAYGGKLRTNRYIGVDVVRYADLPAEIEFIPFDLDIGKAPLPDGF
jgi:hypothetical protein